MSCRGDWYAQGDHARNAAKHVPAADGAVFPAPIPKPRHFCTAVLCCASPFERLPVFRQDTVTLYHIPPKHTSRQGAARNPRGNPPTHYVIRKNSEKCDSAFSCIPYYLKMLFIPQSSRRRQSCARRVTSPGGRSPPGDPSCARPRRSCRLSPATRDKSAATVPKATSS